MKYKCDECKDTGFVGDQHAGRAGYNLEYSYCDCELGKSKNPALYNNTQMDWKDELEEICGEEYIEAVEELIKSLLKKQRVICAKKWYEEVNPNNYFQAILNAPEPEGGTE